MNSKPNLTQNSAGLPAIELLKSKFKRLPNGVIQVGAHNGREVRKIHASGVKSAIFIDPLDETFGQLEEKVGNYDGYKAIQALIGDVDGQLVDFKVSSNSGESSSFLPPADHTKIKPGITFDQTRQLTMRSLDNLLEECEVNLSDFDMLFLDVQGAERHVLLGAMNVLKQMKFIWTEATIGNIYDGDISISRLAVFLEVLGFELAYCQMKPFGWGDALFMRRSEFVGK